MKNKYEKFNPPSMWSKPTPCVSLSYSPLAGGSYLGGNMLSTRRPGETLQEYKERLIREVEMDQMSAEDAFDCYEEAVFNDAEAL